VRGNYSSSAGRFNGITQTLFLINNESSPGTCPGFLYAHFSPLPAAGVYFPGAILAAAYMGKIRAFATISGPDQTGLF
jgi:hypothetical protein